MYPTYSSYWLRAIKAVFPDVYNRLSMNQRAILCCTEFVNAFDMVLSKDLHYSFDTRQDYLMLKFVPVDDTGFISIGFDLDMLNKRYKRSLSKGT